MFLLNFNLFLKFQAYLCLLLFPFARLYFICFTTFHCDRKLYCNSGGHCVRSLSDDSSSRLRHHHDDMQSETHSACCMGCTTAEHFIPLHQLQVFAFLITVFGVAVATVNCAVLQINH